jgi:hypothetical protein
MKSSRTTQGGAAVGGSAAAGTRGRRRKANQGEADRAERRGDWVGFISEVRGGK